MIETKFKDTETGKIPIDWNYAAIKTVAEVKRGVRVTRSQLSINGKYPVFQNTNYPLGYFDNYNVDAYVPFVIIGGSAGLIGKSRIKYWAADDCAYFDASDELRMDYLYYVLVHRQYDLLKHVKTSSVPRLDRKVLEDLHICIPSNIEQSRIASALTSIDNLISSLDKLIEKKKNIKQGTMQQLLTGKKRLKGFSESWIEKKLGLIGITYSGLTGKTKEDFGTGNAKYITFLNVLNNPILNPKQFEYVVIKDGERQNNCRCGDIFFNTSSETPEEVGICAMLDTSMDNLYLNSFCFGYRLTDSNVVPEYLAYYFRSDEGRKLMTVLAQGVTRYNMSKSAFNNAKILMPSNASEQKAITDVLISMDKEIASLKLKKAKYESVKQGMMQQLLTGKIRLV